ncbi:hypothetical protein [Sorangium sp. So ce1153]|uniref:hypothetical protein n=1 Tax=Sorangium sp. So ce1153 TaxID=3133333 RepID=UPI003F633A6F
MSKRRWFSSNGMRRSGNVIHVSPTLLWELSWVRKMGLEDIDWDPERYCLCCRGERADRGEAVEALAPPPSEARPKLLLREDGEDAAASAGASRARSARRGMPRHVKLVRLLRPKPEQT